MTLTVIGGKFEVQRIVGEGAYGIVYETLDVILRRKVAVKTIREDGLGRGDRLGEFRSRFQREARASARLNHPNIVAVYEAGDDHGTFFLAMEFVEGRSLREVLDARGALPLDEVMPLARQILEALGYAHDQGLVHRDVKPENILLSREGVVKIADFGLAKMMSAHSSTVTREGTVVGTPSYMAPEQLLSRPLDRRADLFSTAAVLYELLAGDRPFRAETIAALLVKILHDEPSRLSTWVDVPAHVDDAIMRGLSKKPRDRFGNAEAMLVALLGEGDETAAESVPAGEPEPASFAAWEPPPLGLPAEAGSLAAVSGSRLLMSLGQRQASGLLVVEAADWRMGVDMDNGVLRGVSGGSRETCLGELLVSTGTISARMRDELVRSQAVAAGRIPLGEMSVRQGIISPAQLLEALGRQRDTRVCQLLSARSGRYRLHTSAQLPEWRGMAGDPVPAVVARCLRESDERRREIVHSLLAESAGACIRTTPDTNRVLAEFRLGTRAQRWLRQLDGRSVNAALDGDILPRAEAELALCLLCLSDALTFVPTPAARAPSRQEEPKPAREPLPQRKSSPVPRVEHLPQVIRNPPPERKSSPVPRVEVLPRVIREPSRPIPGTPVALKRAREQCERARELSARRDFAAAVEAFQAAQELDPKNPDILHELAWAVFHSQPGSAHHRGKAMELLERSLELRSTHVPTMIALAKVLRFHGSYDRARAQLRRALSFDFDNAEAKREIETLDRLAAGPGVPPPTE